MKAAIGLCGFCGAPLAPDGARRCSCGRASSLGQWAQLVAGSAQGRGREVPIDQDGERAAAVVRPEVQS